MLRGSSSTASRSRRKDLIRCATGLSSLPAAVQQSRTAQSAKPSRASTSSNDTAFFPAVDASFMEHSPHLLREYSELHQRARCAPCRGTSYQKKASRSSPFCRCGKRDQRLSIGCTSRCGEPMNSWRGRPIFCSGSAIISFHWAIQPTVRAIAKIPVNSDTGMPSADCTMPE
jgi:hypothetical protein